jgi:hypothetical protein
VHSCVRMRHGRPSAQLVIRKLKVEKAAVDVQSEAITRWPAKNDPSPSVERSLPQHGLSGLLKAGISASSRSDRVATIRPASFSANCVAAGPFLNAGTDSQSARGRLQVFRDLTPKLRSAARIVATCRREFTVFAPSCDKRCDPYAFAHGHRPGMAHSDPSTVAFAVGDAILVASVVAGGPLVAVAPKVMADWVGWEKVLTAPLPEPATA